ncbi:MAG: short-chain dehydrogenase [Acidimicrobiia bacterium]|nr:short-chain dehydrogenase [Acidimicrobiia bacterium]
MGELDQSVVIVTGAGSGIGREHALLFGREGASVVVNDVNDPSGVVAEIVAAGGNAIGHRADVSDWVSAHALVEEAVARFGRLDALVNNAGGGSQALASDLTEEAWDHEIQLNLKAMFSPTRAALGWWKQHDAPGAVVNTTSGAGLLGNIGQSPYGSAKAAVAAFTVIAAAELAGTGIRLNAVAPAARTPASLAAGETIARYMRAPDDDGEFDAWHARNISPLVAYLCTRSCDLTGQVFHVRGGVVGHFQGWTIGETATADHNFTIAELRELVPGMVARAPDRADAGGAAYSSLRAAWGQEQAGS